VRMEGIGKVFSGNSEKAKKARDRLADHGLWAAAP